LVVVLAQPSHAGHERPPIVAVRHGSAAQIPEFETLAARLTAGTLCVVICRGIDYDHSRGEQHARHTEAIKAIPASEAERFIPDTQIDGTSAAAAAKSPTPEHAS
jgi:hypothetical protein